MVQINELDSAIECKVVRTDNVKNEIEMDEKTKKKVDSVWKELGIQ